MQASAVPLALILSSYVAASRVGGGGQQYVLAAYGVDPVLVPTVLFGRHPGKGPPGGGPVAADLFDSCVRAALDDVALVHADAVLGGYFVRADQVETAARAIEALRAAPDRRPIGGRLTVVIDPIMGDSDTGLYVRPEVAEAVSARLVPLADWLTPNLWELERLTGGRAERLEEILALARRLPCPALVTSVPAGAGEIGVLCVTPEEARFYVHALQDRVLRGTGDLIAAAFAAGLIEGRDPFAAAERAVAAAAETAAAAVEWNAPELPLVSLGPRLANPTVPVRMTRVQPGVGAGRTRAIARFPLRSAAIPPRK